LYARKLTHYYPALFAVLISFFVASKNMTKSRGTRVDHLPSDEKRKNMIIYILSSVDHLHLESPHYPGQPLDIHVELGPVPVP
jgi:hypothetical protein